ncbi:MAG TPA: NADH-quinone oxidoreductase subunit L [Thermomicrobiales bacterium]|nr:NADH-quinone oxidoreductase subunit L [Thermomicrobiales bacterium]
MQDYLVLIPLLPLVAAIVNFLFGRWFIKDLSGTIAALAVGGSFIVSLFVFLDQYGSDEALRQHLYTWIPAGDFQVPVALFADHLTAVMLLVVTSVSTLVHVYAIGYMKGDPGFYRFFSYLPLFVFSMVMLVLADNFLTLFVFWEAVGLCSYLLIGYYFRRTSAADAAKKAFIVNRIGDFGFGIGIMLLFVHLGSVVFADIFAEIGTLGGGTITLVALLLFTGAIGKSAQLPLLVWLPDAMEGPTPVSALIHAATMVTAGVYMVARSYPIFVLSSDAMLVVAIIGVATAFIAATIGITQFDIKRVIAYSTVSQLGFMVFALGVGAWVAAIFHLATHAFFKALLFLGSGSVIHGMHEEQDMRRMGGLKKYMPITYWTFVIAALANAGIIPLAGFWSKDEIILSSWLDGAWWVTVVAFGTAFLTALYMFRVVFLTFHGKERFDTEHLHPHESPRIMVVPLIMLAIPTVLVGALMGWPPEEGWIHDFLGPVFSSGDAGHALVASTMGLGALNQVAEEAHHVSTSQIVLFGVISTIVAVAGIAVAYLAYIAKSPAFNPEAWSQRYRGAYSFIYRKWRLDELYDVTIVRPGYWLADRLWRFVDVSIIDGTVNGVASVVGFTSSRLRRVQTGFVANYALAIAIGAVIIVGAYFVFVSSLFA